MAQTAESVLKDLKAGRYAPVYFLQGDEPYFIDQLSAYIEKHALTEAEEGFNQVVMYGKDADVTAILNNARRYPMMAERQVVIVKEAKDIQDLNKQEGQAILENYVKNPMPSTVLVFCHKYKTLDGRKALTKTLDKHAVLVTTKKLYDNQIPDWISTYVTSTGFTIDRKAAFMLTEYIGNDLERLTNEIQKVLINFEEKIQIDAALIQKYVGISKEYNVFELQKALAVHDVLKANRIVQYFESNPKNHPVIPVIAMLFSFYSRLLLIHHSGERSDAGVARLLKINPFFAKEYLVAMQKYSLPVVIRNIGFLRQADLQSKGIDSGGMTEGQLLKELVFKLMH
jgi:DNA polymerase-3 subunit delta